MDVLVVEDALLLKADQPDRARVSTSEHLRQFALD